VAHDNLGVELDALGHADEAIAQYREALGIEPSDRNANTNYTEATFARQSLSIQLLRAPTWASA
jgi:hypothetical protein